ncbi:MAG: hypothetical protein M1819_002522 [Sarea resinae]|nr:MAG: hypothetical protein M1819_002522 [Sarea resinae]
MDETIKSSSSSDFDSKEQAKERISELSRTAVERLHRVLQNESEDPTSLLETARSLTSALNKDSIMADTVSLDDGIFLIDGFQRLAFQDADNGGLLDIADWCMAQWLGILQRHPENVAALQGLGQNWLSRAQSSLALIHRDEGSSSSGASVGKIGPCGMTYSRSDEEREVRRASVQANEDRHSPPYVEARGVLRPSTEFFQQAVRAAQTQGLLSGQLLISAAEAHMSLGNVSYSDASEDYFRQALEYLQQASEIPNYSLPSYLQQYLEDFGRLVE